jgi:leucyl-tRNA synthetase
MAERYDPREIEARWQRVWDERQVSAAGARPGAPKDYILDMFPYPSGALHMGHVRVYGIGDVLARFSRMRGNDVLFPIGYDSLGLPAENAAIKDGIHPRVRTAQNIESFRADMRRMAFSFDWSREFATSDPTYYRWNQWFFLRMLERDLVYRRRGWVNWCPTCQTVLANEQVDDGVCWRGHSGVTQKVIAEWAFRITRYAEQLLEGLGSLSEWPERITAMQRNWIGKSEGAEVAFPVPGTSLSVRVFTTRLDTIFGCAALVIAPEHPLTEQLVTEGQRGAVRAFAERMLKSDRITRVAATTEKEGVDTGAVALNPFTGEPLPIWVANFVVADYGTGAVMSVPAHDARDHAFAEKYQLPIKVVVAPLGPPALTGEPEVPFTADGMVTVGGPASGLPSAEARKRLIAEAVANGFGAARVNYQIRDWGFSRQRYWGTPIPVVYCPHEGSAEEPKIIPIPDADLPVRLPDNVELTGLGEAPLAKAKDFVEVACPSCGKPARREVDTMDTFVDSSWYFARFLDPHNAQRPFDREIARHWLPMDTYIGGPEHAVLHLLYFRFWTKVLADLGLCDIREPARRLITQGIVLGADG